MDDSASAIVEQAKLASSQKTKKKQRNKKANGKGSASHLPNNSLSEVVSNDEKKDNVSGSAMIAANGMTAKLEQQLHITGDGPLMNGVSEKCSSKIDSHQSVVQNGHHTPATHKMNNITSSTIAQTQHQGLSHETQACGALKKSKSKNNKQRNKETYLENFDKVKHHSSDRINDEPPTSAITKSTEAINKTTDVTMTQLKNGFHGCVKEQNKELRCVVSQQKSASHANKELSIARQNISNNEIRNSSTTDIAAAPRLSDTTTQQKQLPTNAAVNSNTTYANPPTANSPNLSNTAKQEENDIHQAVAKNKEASAEEPMLVASVSTTPKLDLSNVNIEYKEYESELQMHDIMRLIQAELSEPYSIYTYRYFIYNWPKLCFLAAHGNEYVGAIVCKLDMHMNVRRGYIAMLAVRKEYRKLKIGTTLVQKAIEAMLADNADEVVLETEMRNLPALRLYENLGFVRDKRLFRYYLNGVDALRLKLWFR